MSVEHTLGPWTVGKRLRNAIEIDAPGRKDIVTVNGLVDGEVEANARLVVELPEMLLAAELLLMAMKGNNETLINEQYRRLTAVVVKILGD
jgi:hypothetical protein